MQPRSQTGVPPEPNTIRLGTGATSDWGGGRPQGVRDQRHRSCHPGVCR